MVDCKSKDGLVVVGSTVVDCSEEAQKRRRDRIALLEDQLITVTAVSSISDRGRAVTYRTRDDILDQLRDLKAELAFCCFGVLPQPRLREWRRPFQIKGL